MSSVCFITTCMGRLAHLEQSLPSVLAQPDASAVVVDYSCPDRAGDWVESTYPAARVVRVPGETRFNRSRAANAGAQAADAPWLCFFDCDVVVAPGFASVLAGLRPGGYYHGDPVDTVTCGTFACARADFDRCGGFDEAYQGYGERDLDLYRTFETMGVERRAFASSLLHHLEHDDEDRTRFHDQRARQVSRTINTLYRLAKFDLIQAAGGPLPFDVRQALYRVSREEGTRIASEARPRAATIALEQPAVTLRYRIFRHHEPPWRRLAKNAGRVLEDLGMLKRRRQPFSDWLYQRRLPITGRLSRPLGD